MALSYKTRKRLALLILIVGVPLYIMSAVTVISWFDRPAIWVEFLVYVGMGIVWIVPLKPIFKGVGQADPNDTRPPEA